MTMLHGNSTLLVVNDFLAKLHLPLFIVVGTVLNVLSMVIWVRRMRLSTLAVFLFSLSIVETGGLLLEPVFRTLRSWFDVEPERLTHVCHAFHFLYHSLLMCSLWLIFFASFDQTIKLCFPQKDMINQKRAAYLTIGTVFASAGFYVSRLVNHDIPDNSSRITSSLLYCNQKPPDPNQETRSIFEFDWDTVELLLSRFFPMTLTFGCILACVDIGIHIYRQTRNSVGPLPKGLQRTRKQMDFLRIISVLGVLTVMLTLPMVVFRVEVTAVTSETEEIEYTILSMLHYTGYMLRCLVYYACSKVFRNDLRIILNVRGLRNRIERTGSSLKSRLDRRTSQGGMSLRLFRRSGTVTDIQSDDSGEISWTSESQMTKSTV